MSRFRAMSSSSYRLLHFCDNRSKFIDTGVSSDFSLAVFLAMGAIRLI